MKAIRWIQNLAAVAALIIALNVANDLTLTFKDACTAGILIVMAVAMLLERAIKQEKIL